MLLLSNSLENILATLSIPLHELLCAQPAALFLVEVLFWWCVQLLLFGWRVALCSLPLFQFSRSTCPQKKGNTTKPQNNSNRFHNTTSSRRDCLEIRGIPLTSTSTDVDLTDDVVLKIGEKIGVPMQKSDISISPYTLFSTFFH